MSSAGFSQIKSRHFKTEGKAANTEDNFNNHKNQTQETKKETSICLTIESCESLNKRARLRKYIQCTFKNQVFEQQT